MNGVKVTITHSFFKQPMFKPFSVTIDHSDVSINNTNEAGHVQIRISGESSANTLKSLFFKIFDLFFIRGQRAIP